MNKFDEALKKIKDVEDFVLVSFKPSREKSIVITKLDEARMWMTESKIHNDD